MARVALPARTRAASARTAVAVASGLVAVALVLRVGAPERVAWVQTFFIRFRFTSAVSAT